MKQMFTMIAIAIAITLANTARANEVITNVNFQGNTCTELNLAKSIDQHFGTFAYAARTDGWHEVYGGGTLSPAPWIQVGVAAGIEKDQPNVRFGGFLWADRGRTALLVLAEDGGSGKWYRIEGKYALTSTTTVGLLQEINLGTGAIIEQKLVKNLTLRVRAYQDGKGDAGVKVAF